MSSELVNHLEVAAQWDDSPSEIIHEAIARIEALETENARLMEALGDLLNCVDGQHDYEWLARCKEKARKALYAYPDTSDARCQCDACKTVSHASSCAGHNDPAYPNGPSDCDKQVVPSGYSEYTPIKVVGSTSEPRGCPVPGACKPSDRPADVTVDEIAKFMDDHMKAWMDEGDFARAILDPFKVVRRK